MSAGSPILSVYEANAGGSFPIRIQPETLTLTINGVANAAGTGTPAAGTPSASVSRGRRTNGVNARLVRFKFTATLPPGYAMDRTLTLPILTPAVYNGIVRGQTGTYTLEGTAYDIQVSGVTPESVR